MKKAYQSLSEDVRASLSVSWKEGIPAQIMVGIFDYYLVPYALFLGASSTAIGFLVAVPHLLASIFQLFAVAIIRHAGSRLHFLVRSVFAQATVLLPLALLAFLPFQGRIVALVLFVILFRILGNLIATAWGSLMSDYLPARLRGRYFGWRSQIVGLAGLAGLMSAGVLLFWMKGIYPALGFFIIFFAAVVFRFLSFRLMARMSDLPLKTTPESDFTFYMFVRRFRESNFVKYVIFVSGMIFATNLAAPYFSVYMLRDLHFSYLTYMAITFVSVFSGLISYPIWGRHADVVGNAKILKITGVLVPMVPLFWLVTKNPLILMLIEIYSGFIWGGFNLCATNFIFDAVSPDKRIRCLGYFTLINGVAIFLGATLGGFLADHLPPILGFSILTLFLISAMLRFIAYFFLSQKFTEVRESTQRASSFQLFFSVLGISPLAGMAREWNLFPIFRPYHEL